MQTCASCLVLQRLSSIPSTPGVEGVQVFPHRGASQAGVLDDVAVGPLPPQRGQLPAASATQPQRDVVVLTNTTTVTRRLRRCVLVSSLNGLQSQRVTSYL